MQLQNRTSLDQAIRDAGLTPPEHYVSGRSRLDRSDKKAGNKAGSLWVKENLELAVIKNWSTSETVTWNATGTTETTPEQRKQWAKERAAQKKRDDAEKARNATRAAKRARALVAGAKNTRNHRYAQEKGLTVDFLVNNNAIVVAGYRDGEMVTAQTITPDGTKKFIFGGSTAGIIHQFGDDSDVLVIAEGWATGARIHQITGLTVIVVFSADNLAKYIKPDSCKQLLIATDNDKSRAGENAAAKLQQRYPDAVSILPPTIGTDWADYSANEVKSFWADYLPRQININSRYLPSHMLDAALHLIIQSPHDSGKSFATREWIRKQVFNEKSVLVVCNGKAQVTDTLTRLNDDAGHRFDDYRYGDDVIACSSRLVICVDSLLKVQHNFNVIVFDESEQLTAAPMKQDLFAAKQNINGRKELAHRMTSLANKAERTLWLDADAGSLTQDIIKHADIKATTITNHYKVLSTATAEFVGLDELGRRIKADPNQWHLYCTEPKTAKTMQRRYGGRLATGRTKTKNEKLVQHFAGGLPFTDNLITNSAIQSSVSIDNHNIKTVYARVKIGKGLPSLDSVMQGLRRARGVEKFVICIETKALKAPLSVDPERIVYDDITEPNIHNRLYLKRCELMTSSAITGQTIDPVLQDLYGHHRAQQNHERNNPQAYLMERFREAGAAVIDAQGSDTGEQTRTIEKTIRADIKADELQQIATADIPTEAEHRQGIGEQIPQILARAKHETDAGTDDDVREIARREYLKNERYISGAKRLERDLKSAEQHAADDIERAKSGDPLNRPQSLLVHMKKEIIQLVYDAGLLDGREFSSHDLEPVVRSWLLDNGCVFAKMSGRRVGDPSKIRAGQTVVTLLESWGVWVERIDGEQKRYSVNPDDATTRKLLTYCKGTVLLCSKSGVAA